MAGHNKWSKVKRIKGAIDAKRGKLFSKLAKEIAVAAKLGGPDSDANVRLRSVITSARTQNIPNGNADVLNVYSNFDLPPDLLEQPSGQN